MTTNLSEIRESLLELHKALLEYQKHAYESTVGPMRNPNHYYQLVIGDPSFAWLRTLSALVVSIDELLESKEMVSEAKLSQIATYTNSLLTAQSEDVFAKNYSESLQNDPAVKQLHNSLLQLLA